MLFYKTECILCRRNSATKNSCDLTKAVCVVMKVPPAAPVNSRTLSLLSITRVGHMDDIGILPGAMKLVGEAGTR